MSDNQTQFEKDLDKMTSVNGSPMSMAMYNLIVSKRDFALWQRGVKPTRHWTVTNAKRYFGIKGHKDTLVGQLEAMSERYFPTTEGVIQMDIDITNWDNFSIYFNILNRKSKEVIARCKYAVVKSLVFFAKNSYDAKQKGVKATMTYVKNMVETKQFDLVNADA